MTSSLYRYSKMVLEFPIIHTRILSSMSFEYIFLNICNNELRDIPPRGSMSIYSTLVCLETSAAFLITFHTISMFILFIDIT